VDTVHECDRRTDRQTNRQTDRITITKTVQRIASPSHGNTVQRIASHGKKERKGKAHKVTSALYFTYLGSRPLWTDLHENWHACRVHDVIIQSKFGFNILRGFRSIGGWNGHFPIDFAGHRYNSAAATVQPVIHKIQQFMWHSATIQKQLPYKSNFGNWFFTEMTAEAFHRLNQSQHHLHHSMRHSMENPSTQQTHKQSQLLLLSL